MPAGGTKRKKHHDKDKYYRLAKEQGLRSRAAFKLTQINRKYSLLTPQTKAVLDLCAAPGGWTQIASRTLPQTKSLIVAVDILPIRSLGSAARNVVTLVGDITTSQCQSEIRKELQTLKLDVVLCDGAPDVGASYDKDAFNQNEIALAALKCATQHLKPGGSFLTKIYRSRDYASYLWVVKQFFGSVEAVKPAASRMQSAEMFLVCKDYLAPEKIDGKMLDPRAVFGEIEEEEGGSKNVNIFHKKFNEQKKSRQGYDLTNLDATMRQLKSVSEFIEGSDPISMLSQCHGLRFSSLCQKYLNHSATDEEVKLCIPDLKVLNRGDFKHILSWREKLRESITNASPDDNDVDMEDTTNEKSETQDYDSDEEEKRIQQEISELKEARLRKKKKEKKKEREVLAKKRRRIALGMEDSAIDIPEEEKVFTLAQITSKGDLEAVREVNLEDMEDDDNDDDDEINLGDGGPAGGDDDSVYFESDRDEETGYDYRLDRELDEAYETYLSKTKNAEAKKGTKMAKRTKKQRKERAKMKAEEDDQLENVLQGSSEADALAYAKLLTGKGGENSSDDDDDDADDEDDGFHAEPLTPAEHVSRKRRDNPLIYEVPDNEPTSAKTARWFENPLFKDISSLTVDAVRRDDTADDSSSDESSSDDDDDDDNLNAEAVLALMPKTEKQKRHDKRIKDRARREAREKRRARKAGETPDMEIVAAEDAEKETINDTAGMTPAQKKKLLEARDLIKKGLGTQQNDDALNSSTFEIVPPLPAIDTRKYDSDNESYDSDDRARTLALGTMILRPSRAKAFADASYNRYAWNDPEELPEWFQDDESRNYRPQLPIPKGLLEKMKERQMELAAKPIKKVAEARARKNKRAKLKLAAAKKKAESVVNSSDMTEAQKLKAISKALRGQESKKPGKTYVVSKKGGKTRGGKGIALVDKRMKNDKRAMDRADKKRKKGKQGGMTGSKKRRHHS